MEVIWQASNSSLTKELPGLGSTELTRWPFHWATIAQWIWLHLPSFGPVFKSQAQHVCFFLNGEPGKNELFGIKVRL